MTPAPARLLSRIRAQSNVNAADCRHRRLRRGMLDPCLSVGKSKKMHANPLRIGLRPACRGGVAGLVALTALLALDAHAAATATVVSSTPVVVSVAVPRQVCSDGTQLVQPRPSGAGAVIGAIAGGVIGHQFGGGFGRAAATGVGAVTGAIVGDQVEAANAPVTEVPVRRCQTTSAVEQRVVGYDVVYEYAGQRYSTRMARDPGRQLAVNVQPADGSLPAPIDAGQIGTPVPPATTSAPQPIYSATSPVYYDYAPAPAYYVAPSPVLVAPAIGFGFGYYGGGYYRHRHWR